MPSKMNQTEKDIEHVIWLVHRILNVKQAHRDREQRLVCMAREGSGGGVKWMKGVKGTNLTVVK